MTSLSKMLPVASRGLLKPASFMMPAIRESHANLFRKRPPQLISNRIKDFCHFYFIGIGVLPVMLCLAYNHIVYGTCELKDYPEGEPPHYWQFERTPVRQWWAKHFGISDIEHHERNLAYYEKLGIQARWRSGKLSSVLNIWKESVGITRLGVTSRCRLLGWITVDGMPCAFETNTNNMDIIRNNLFDTAAAMWKDTSSGHCWDSR
ncbi:hypothetical protein COOONC_18575 [Cooperia oncophora]